MHLRKRQFFQAPKVAPNFQEENTFCKNTVPGCHTAPWTSNCCRNTHPSNLLCCSNVYVIWGLEHSKSQQDHVTPCLEESAGDTEISSWSSLGIAVKSML